MIERPCPTCTHPLKRHCVHCTWYDCRTKDCDVERVDVRNGRVQVKPAAPDAV